MANSKIFIKQVKAAQKQARNIEKQISISKKLDKKYKHYSFPTPPVYSGNWSFKAWCEWIEKYGKITN